MKTTIVSIAAAIALLAAPSARAAWTVQQSNGSGDTVYISIGAGSGSVAAAVGIDNSQGNTQALYAVTADGETWGAAGFTAFASAVEFADASTGYAGGMVGKVWRTTDGGFSWAELADAVIGGTLMDSETIADVAIADGGATVWIIGATGRCAHSEDGGATWHHVDVPLPPGEGLTVTAGELRGGTIWLVGGAPMAEPSGDTDGSSAGNPASAGFVLRSGDGGETFETIASGLEYELTDVSFANPAEGWAAAAKYAEGGGAVGVTIDGGESWDFVALPDLPEEEVAFAGMGSSLALGACAGVKFFGRLVGVASCTTRTFDLDGTNALYLTTDGGETWELEAGYKAAFSSQMVAAMAIMDTAFPDCHRGWLAGEGKVIARWDNDDAALDCAAGGAPGDDIPDDVGGGGGSRDGCGCAAVGSAARPGGTLLGAVFSSLAR